MIRDANLSDAGSIAHIWNLAIRNTTTTFDSVEKSTEQVIDILAEKQRQSFPFLIYGNQSVEGFATYGQFRAGIGYALTMEHTIHLAPKARGSGIGKVLMIELEKRAANAGICSLIAGISGDNQAAIKFHSSLGYHEIARLPQVGRKFNRWFDLVLMQRFLTKER